MYLPAVNDHGAGVPWVGASHLPDEVEHGGGVLGHPVVRPGGEVELLDDALLPGPFLLEGEGPHGVVRQHQDLLHADAYGAVRPAPVLLRPVLVALELWAECTK